VVLNSFFQLSRLRRNLRMDFGYLEKLQRKRLRAIIKHAYENVAFYHRKFDEAHVKPDDIKCVADLPKLPSTTKEELQEASFGNLLARNVDLKSCFRRTTSGSTGVPLTLFLDSFTAALEGAVWTRTFLENGLKVRDKMAVIADPRIFPKKSFVQRFGLMSRKYLSIFDSAERQFKALQAYKPDAIKGYLSSLFILAELYTTMKSSFKPRIVFTSAELLDNVDRRFINSSFHVDLLDNYACNEFGLLAWECSEHGGYHMNVDRAVIEFVNENGPVASGESGEIVCTSLFNWAMPLIRYRIEDVGTPIDEPCSCGRTLPLMKMIMGRKDDFLTATDGRLLSPTIFFPYPFEDLKGIRRFRVVQRKRTKMEIQLYVNKSFVDETQVFNKARKEIQRIFGEDMEVDFQLLDRMSKDSNGKLRKIVSMVKSN
jgi:phenylacetate-CoA ligase